MKKTIFSLSILFFVLLAIFIPTLPANAASIAGDRLHVLHPKTDNTVTMGEQTFSYKTFAGEDASEISITEITQPAKYKGFLLRKHVLQTPEEVYILDGNFEFAFSQSNKKVKAKKRDIVSIPAGVPFGFRHTDRGEGKVLIVSRSIALPNMLSEIDTYRDKNSEPDIQIISSIARKYGIEFLD